MKQILLVVLVSAFALAGYTQEPGPTPPNQDGTVVKISTNLIRVDATVTDKNGKTVPGLTVDDFEVFENGERQKLEGVTYITKTIGGATVTGGAADAQPGPPTAGAQGNKITPDNVGSTIAILVDDLNLSFASIYYTRAALKKFVDTQMAPNDLVAIIRTGGGVGALQQFTSDKRLLYAAIDRLRYNPLGGSAIDPLTPVGQNSQDITERFKVESDRVASQAGQDSSGRKNTILTRDNISDKKATDYNAPGKDESELGVYAQASIGTMRYVIGGMNELPGRKVMMLFSDGITISDRSRSRGAAVYEMLKGLIEYANRSSVVVYTFDTRGLQSMEFQASDGSYEVIDGHRQAKVRIRLEDFKRSQEGLHMLADQTGGKALLDSNGLNEGIQRAIDEQSGYYLLSYIPDTDTFEANKRRFNKLEVKVSRPGLHVNYRSGFFTTVKSESEPTAPGADRQIANALSSPFGRNDIPLNLNALYADDPADGPYIRSFLHIDAKTLNFTDEADGSKKATFDIAAVAFGDNGMPLENKESRYTIRTKGPTYETMLKNGFVYVLIMPVKKPGVYQYRAAVRDINSGKIGSASQVIEVPDLSKHQLAISAIAAEGVTPSIWQNITEGKVGNGPGQIHVASTLLYDTVERQFVAGNILRYGYEVYNAKLDGAAPRLETQARIMQNNRVIVEGSVNKFDAAGQPDLKHIKVSGAVMLRDTLAAGDYVLEIAVTDTVAKKRSIQMFPFEIIK